MIDLDYDELNQAAVHLLGKIIEDGWKLKATPTKLFFIEAPSP